MEDKIKLICAEYYAKNRKNHSIITPQMVQEVCNKLNAPFDKHIYQNVRWELINLRDNDPEVDIQGGLTPSVDYNRYPRSRSYLFGVNLSF